MRNRGHITELLVVAALALAAPASANTESGTYANMGTCNDGSPREYFIVDATSATSCAAGGSTFEAHCCCKDGTWAVCDSGGGGGSVIFDIGDDGGNDSTSLAELSTVNDDYSAVTEPSADEVQIDFARIAPYQQYDPDRPPSSCATCEEFTGSFSQTWTWGNQGSATDVVEQGMGKIDGPGAGAGRVFRALAAPSGGTDFTVTAKMFSGYEFTYSTTDSNGIWILEDGTVAAPTKFYEIITYPTGNWGCGLYGLTMTGFNSWSSTQINFAASSACYVGLYIQARYTASNKHLDWYFSLNGRIWTWGALIVLTNHPSYVGRSNSDGTNPGYFEFFRIRTDADRNLAGE